MRRRKLIAIALLSVVATLSLAALGWGLRSPVELQFVGSEAADFLGSESTGTNLLELRVQNRQDATIEFHDEVQCEARVGNRWVGISDTWTVNKLAGARSYGKAQGSAGVALLVPADTTACRFRLKYRHLDKRPLPLGIGDPWARREAPSLVALRVQQVTALACRPLYNWLWPATPPKRPVKQPGRWWSTTAKVEFQEEVNRSMHAFEKAHSQLSTLEGQ